MKDVMISEFYKWLNDLSESIKEDPGKIVLIFFLLILIQAMANVLLSFGWFTYLGFYATCIFKFKKILDNPSIFLIWGVGYAMGATVTPLVFSLALPEIKAGTWVSIFSGLFIFYVLVMLWLKARQLKGV
jgi:hypothetical protein